MTEQATEIDEQSDLQTSPGQILKQARESAGLSQQALADKILLKINVIKSLEADEIDPQTSMTFTKGYVRLYAKQVGLDPEPLMIEFDRLYHADKRPQKLQSFSKRVSNEANDHRWMMVTYVILSVVITLVVVWWYQQPANNDISLTSETLTTPSVLTPTAITADEPSSAENSSDSDSIETELTVQSTLEQPVLVDQTSLEPELESEESEPLEPPVAAPVASENAPSNNIAGETMETSVSTAAEIESSPTQLDEGSVELVFTFADDCWVNIVDASGEAIAYGVKAKGRVMPVSGVPPFSVTLGAPQVVSITYAGNNVSLSAFTAGQTARFELPMQE